MLNDCRASLRIAGFTLLEVLIAILITAFGLLGLAGLMSKMQLAETEGYSRSQASALLTYMVERVQDDIRPPTYTAGVYDYTNYLADVNAFTNSGGTVTVGTSGTGVTSYTSPCTGSGPAFDLCEWNFALQGAAETRSSTQVGAMAGARGCVTLVSAANTATGTCHPATIRVTVVWQGLVNGADESSDANTCAADLYGAKNLGQRRIVAQQITVGIPRCTN